MINELDRVILTVDIPEKGLAKGYIGTVVDKDPAGKGYVLEFFTLKGDTFAVVGVLPDQVREIADGDMARAVAAE